MAFTYGDYTVVIYTDRLYGNKKYAHFQVTDTFKESYSAIPATVTYQGKSYPVSLYETPDDSENYLPGCFDGCRYLITPPELPAGIKSLYCTFTGCTSLTTTPTIPASVQDMSRCFLRCTSLTTAPTIPSSVQNMSYCFYECASLATAPTIPSSVKNLNFCFRNCTSLATAPAIPASVQDMSGCFMGDVNLSGNIVINAAVRAEAYYSSVLADTKKGIWLTGSSPYLQSYANTASKYNVFVGEIPLSYNLTVERVSTDGEITPDPEGTWLHLILDLSWSRFEANSIDSISLQKNTTAVALTWYTDAAKTSAVTLPGWQPNAATTIHAWVQATVNRQILILSVSDTYHTGKSLEVMVPSSFRTIDFLAGGKGIAFGKVAEQEGFDCAMETFFDDQVHTSFASSVAMGSYGSSQTTIPDFVDEIRYSSGAAGSVSIGAGYGKDGVTIFPGWYNFMYMPHRTGGKNGQVDPDNIDNVEYGNLLLFGFATGSGRYDITIEGGVISKLVKLITSEDVRKPPTTSTHTKNVGKIAANTYKNCETSTITPTAAQSGLTPCISGWDVQGTGTASCQIMGVYLSGTAASGYKGHIKLKNDSTSQIGDVTIEVRILWV